MSDSIAGEAVAAVERLEKENARLRLLPVRREVCLDQKDYLARIERFERECGPLREKLAATTGLKADAPKRPNGKYDFIIWHDKLQSHHAYLTASLAAAGVPQGAASPSAQAAPVPVKPPLPSFVASPSLSRAHGKPAEVNLTELCRQDIAARGAHPLRTGKDGPYLPQNANLAASEYEKPAPMRGEQAVHSPSPAEVPGAPVAGQTLTERCRAANLNQLKPARVPNLTAKQARGMTLTELCQAARDYGSATDSRLRDEWYEAQREGVKRG